MEIQPIKRNRLSIKIHSIKGNSFIKAIIIFITCLLVIYFSLSMYFSNHFYFGTKINNINGLGKTVDDLDELLLLKSKSYTLELTERNGATEQIKSADIGLKYNAKDKIQALKDEQKSFGWISSIFKQKNSKVEDIVTYDEKLLKEQFDKLSCFDDKKIIEPQNANFEYKGVSYEIVNEVMGNKVNRVCTQT